MTVPEQTKLSFFQTLPTEVLGLILASLDYLELQKLLEIHPSLKKHVLLVRNGPPRFFQIDGLLTMEEYPRSIDEHDSLKSRNILLVLYEMTPADYKNTVNLKFKQEEIYKFFTTPFFERIKRGTTTFVYSSRPAHSMPHVSYTQALAEFREMGMKVIEDFTLDQGEGETSLTCGVVPHPSLLSSVHFLNIELPRSGTPHIVNLELPPCLKELRITYHTHFPQFQDVQFQPNVIEKELVRSQFLKYSTTFKVHYPHISLIDVDSQTSNCPSPSKWQIQPIQGDLNFLNKFASIFISGGVSAQIVDSLVCPLEATQLIIHETRRDSSGVSVINAPNLISLRYTTRIPDSHAPVLYCPKLEALQIESSARGLKIDSCLQKLPKRLRHLCIILRRNRGDPPEVFPEQCFFERCKKRVRTLVLSGVAAPFVTNTGYKNLHLHTVRLRLVPELCKRGNIHFEDGYSDDLLQVNFLLDAPVLRSLEIEVCDREERPAWRDVSISYDIATDCAYRWAGIKGSLRIQEKVVAPETWTQSFKVSPFDPRSCPFAYLRVRKSTKLHGHRVWAVGGRVYRPCDDSF